MRINKLAASGIYSKEEGFVAAAEPAQRQSEVSQ